MTTITTFRSAFQPTLGALCIATSLLVSQGANAALVNYDFSSGNQGFTAAGTTGAGPAFFYSSPAWTVNGVGSEGTSRLAAPVFTASGGDVTVSFLHSYNFEASWDDRFGEWSAYDGARLLVAIGGGAEALVDGFTSGGYTAFVGGLGGWGWTGPASGVTSTVNLGSFAAGTSIALVWQAGWDFNSQADNPNWTLNSVSLDGVQTAAAPVPGTLALCALGLVALGRRLA